MDIPFLLEFVKNRRILRSRERWDRANLDAFQRQRLWQLRQHAYRHSPFYERLHRNLFNAPLSELPITNKSLLMENFDEVVTDRSIRLTEVEKYLNGMQEGDHFRNYWVCATSGSTGRRGIFVFNREEWMTILASFDRGSRWSCFKQRVFPRSKVASVTSTVPWHMSPQAMATTKTWIMPVLRLHAASPMKDIAEELNSWQPDLVVAYPSVWRQLAEEQMASRLNISPLAILSASEVLNNTTRLSIEKAWRRKPFDQYAATEAGFIAAECSQHSGLHVFSDHVILEVVDRNYRPVAEGTIGERALITVLFGRTQPLIRYELTDMIRMANVACACGSVFPLIEHIQGRTDALLYFPGAQGEQITVHPIVFEHLMETTRATEWQFTRDGEALKILLAGVAENYQDEHLIVSIKQELRSRGAMSPQIVIERVSRINKGLSGKLPRHSRSLRRPFSGHTARSHLMMVLSRVDGRQTPADTKGDRQWNSKFRPGSGCGKCE